MLRAQGRRILGVIVLPLLLAACNGDGDGDGAASPTPTLPEPSATVSPAGTGTIPQPTGTIPQSTATIPQPTATPTTPTEGLVSGVVVLHRDVRASTDDALAAPPESWSEDPDSATFDRALSHAEWRLSGPVALVGTTGPDGVFQIPNLPPGDYELAFTKTLNGILLTAVVPFTVGPDGGVELLIEIARGAVRSAVSYRDGGVSVREVRGPNGTHLISRDGVISELGDSGRTLVDEDGDGLFDPVACSEEIWLCGDERTCGPGRQCACTSSCPFCEDCGAPVCVPRGTPPPYRCQDDGACALPGDRCVCVSSCAGCDDCALSVCVPACEPVDIVGLNLSGPSLLTLGQRSPMRAFAQLSGGGHIDVTYLVAWRTSDESIVSIDSWGTIGAQQIGTASVSATLGDIASEPWPIEVVARAPLRRIFLQNLSCYPLLGGPGEEPGPPPDPTFAPEVGDALPPLCHQVVRIGGSLRFTATGEFEDGHYEDLTAEVEWQLTPPEVGDVLNGLFTAREVGTAELRAVLDGIASNTSEIRVVSEPTVVSLSIYPVNAPVSAFPPIFEPGAFDVPYFCPDCPFGFTVLLGDVIHFRAGASYDTGEWEDVTEQVTWRSSDPAVATIDATGVMTAVGGGDAEIDATLDEVTSAPAVVTVVTEATLLGLSIYQDGQDRVIQKGAEAFFRASGYYDVGFERDLTAEATWRSSNVSVGGFDEPGVFIGRAAGTAQVWAESGGVRSNPLPIEVFETSDITYCDPYHINRGTWSDAFNRVVLESDCAHYTPPGVATLRFTVTERERPIGIFDPCLDLYVFQGNQRVRTIREEGCGEPFLPTGAPEFDDLAPRFQTLAFWDLKDNRGNVVPPGVYTVYGRFYLYYDPVVSIDVAVVAPNGRIPCQPNDCGNGCGEVLACGDTDPPHDCPSVCVPLCECPQGWGITEDGDCEPCPPSCCAEGAACAPDIPPCEPVPECCEPNETCAPALPPCERECCPAGTRCGADIPPCAPEPCCPSSDLPCTPELPPCKGEFPCCPTGLGEVGVVCLDVWPPCDVDPPR